MSYRRNRAGNTLVVDRLIELYGSSNASTVRSLIAQRTSTAQNTADSYYNSMTVEIVGTREVGLSSITLYLQASVDGTAVTDYSGISFSWTRPNNPDGWEEATTRSITVTADDIVESPEVFNCTLTYTDSLGNTRKKIASCQIAYATIRQYQWTNATTESALNKADSAWSTSMGVQPDNVTYLWIRESEDGGETWTYYRMTGVNGWSSKTISLYKRSSTQPDSFDGGTLTYTFSTNGLSGDLGTWSESIPTGDDAVWVIYGSVLSQTDIATITPGEWTTPVQVSLEGTQGESGISVATVSIYIRQEEQPATPSEQASYSFTNFTLSDVSPWSQSVPSGTDKLWISQATAASRTDVAHITPEGWSVPVVFAENGVDGKDGEDGLGITSTEVEYAISDSEDEAPTSGWTTVRQEREAGQVLWMRIKITYTDDTIEYSDAIPITGDAGDSSVVSVQYAWGPSTTVPPMECFWFWDKKFYLWKGTFITHSAAVWSDTKPSKPDGEWYLWIRFSYDGGVTWDEPICLNTSSADFSIDGSATWNTNRGITTVETTLTYIITRQGTLTGDISWTVESDGDVVSLTYDGDVATVVIPYGTDISTFTVTATIGTLARTKIVQAVDVEASIEYLGVYPRSVNGVTIDKPTTAKDGKPLVEGDHITYISDEGTDVYVWVEDNSAEGGHWTNTLSDFPEDYLYQIAMDSLYDITSMAASGEDMQPVTQGAAWAFVTNIAAVNAFIENVFAQTIRVGGVIYGGGYDAEGSNVTDEPGFHLDAITGILRANGAILDGAFECSNDDGIIMKTYFGQNGDTLECSAPERWNSQDLCAALSDGDTGTCTYNGTEYTYLRIASSYSFSDTFSTSYLTYAPAFPCTISVTFYTTSTIFAGTTFHFYHNGNEYTYSREGITRTVSFDMDGTNDLVIWHVGLSDYTITVEYSGIDGVILYSDIRTPLYLFSNTREAHTLPFVIDGVFDSSENITMATVEGWTQGLSAGDNLVFDYTESVITVGGKEYQITAGNLTNSYLSLVALDSTLLTFLREVDTSEFSQNGWYEISGSLTLTVETRGIACASIYPSVDDAILGLPSKPYMAIYAENAFLGDSELFSTAGYSMLPNGLMLQWGILEATSDASAVAREVTFPVAFSDTPYWAFASQIYSTTSDANYYGYLCSTSGTTIEGALTATTARFSTYGTMNLLWMAIGPA